MSEAISDPDRVAPQPPPSPERAASNEGAAEGGPPRKKRRRGSRGGRNRSRAPGEARGLNSDSSDDGDDGDEDRQPEELPDPPTEGRPSPQAAATATVPYKPKIGDTRPAPASAAPAAPVDGDGGSSTGPKKKRRRGGRGRKKGGNQTVPRVTVASDADGDVDGFIDDAPIQLDEETLERRRGRERNGRPLGRYMMAVHVQERATHIAVLEGRSLLEHYISRPQDDVSQIDGNIYLARVQNVLPGMEAAFVDIGTPKNAVLYRGDVRYDSEDVDNPGENSQSGGRGKKNDLRIEQMLRGGQTILCQVTKNPIGTKGARLTQEVSLPGRFVVLIPNSDTYGISKRLSDDERKRLRRILDEVKPAQHGVIVRTAAEGTTADELRRDVLRLLRQWEQIESLAKGSKAPALLYREPDMAVRVIREEFNKEYRGVVIDDPNLYEEVREYVESITPELADRVELYDPAVDGLPIFERYHVHEQLHKALDRKVWLPSGGSLIIERTEALTVIDVNTGKNVGTSNLEETVFRNNLEAAQEIARQLRLRDIGGIIVIDFIDMEIKANREEVIKSFRDALARDKTRTQVFDISELGLVEMTRKRISEGLVESFSATCPSCSGRGIVIDQDMLDE